MSKFKSANSLNRILFILELGTLLYFIPLLIYIAEYSFRWSGVGFFAGMLVVIHYYIYKWYLGRGSLVYLGLSILFGSLAVSVSWFSESLRSVFFPAQYLLEYSAFILPETAQTAAKPLFFYYVFLTGLVYTSIARLLFIKLLKIKSGVKADKNVAG